MSVAAAFAGIDDATAYRWLAEGRQQESGPFRDFYDAVSRARAATEAQLVGHVLRDVAGGYVRSRRTRTLRDGSVEVEEDRAGPNGTLGLKVLQAALPSRWSAKAVVEMSGPDGSPIQVESGERERALAARLQQFIAERGTDQPATPSRARNPTCLTGQAGGKNAYPSKHCLSVLAKQRNPERAMLWRTGLDLGFRPWPTSISREG